MALFQLCLVLCAGILWVKAADIIHHVGAGESSSTAEAFRQVFHKPLYRRVLEENSGAEAVQVLESMGREIGVVLLQPKDDSIFANLVNPSTVTVMKLRLTIKQMVDCFRRLLNSKGLGFHRSLAYENIKEILPYLCSVSLDYSSEIMIHGNEGIRVPEALFKPSRCQNTGDGIHKVIYDFIMKDEEYFRTEMFGNIVLSGAGFKIPGMEARVKKELEKLTNETVDVTVAN